MGDMGDLFNTVREMNQKNRQRRRDRGETRLKESGLRFKQFSADHFRVWPQGSENYFDYWPSTGRAQTKDKKKEVWGIQALLKVCKPLTPPAAEKD